MTNTDAAGVTHIKIFIDPYRSNDRTVWHEWGHESDARKKGGNAWTKEALDDKKKFPNKEDHDKRGVEQTADKWADQVERESKEHRKSEKQKRREKLQPCSLGCSDGTSANSPSNKPKGDKD